jgi:lipopolysaccharide/colanic/teichoic acid biosynthesis glycosyltransferase
MTWEIQEGSSPQNQDDSSELVIDLRPEPGHLQRAPHEPTRYERFVKPAFDRIAGAVLSLLTLPVVGIVVVAIWATMGRPAIFSQQRIGQGGTPFTLFKFRSMVPDRRIQQTPFAGEERRRVHKSPDDPRVTAVGAFIRKWSLDEIPQFWNVVRGQMSLVGPRPELLEIVESKYEAWQHQRHAVKPGVTGIWQISDQRQGLMLNATRIDLHYLDRISFLFDLRILLLTAPAAFGYRRPADSLLSSEESRF